MKISEEMIGLAAHQMTGMYGATCCHVTGGSGPVTGRKEATDGCTCRETATAILALVAPLIVEECARVARETVNEMRFSGESDLRSVRESVVYALRALAKEPAQAEGGK